MLLVMIGLHNKILNVAIFGSVKFLAFFSDLPNFKNGCDEKLLDRLGSNFFREL